MKRNSLILTVGIVVALIFGAMFVCFQVRQNEIALVTTFGKPTRSINTDPANPEPGLYIKWPPPIQKYQLFDKRIQNLEGRFEQTLTQDKQPLMVSIYAGWTIADPAMFRERFAGSVQRAENDLEGLLNSKKNEVIAQHPFSQLISTDEKELKFTEIEKDILLRAQPEAKANYGIDVNFLGIKRLGLPEANTQKVFDRMKEERQRIVQKLQAEGDAKARDIRSLADRERAETLAKAEGEVIKIKGAADAEASKQLAVFEKNPDLAIFLLKINALEQSLKERATLILDERTPPFDLLNPKAKEEIKSPRSK